MNVLTQKCLVAEVQKYSLQVTMSCFFPATGEDPEEAGNGQQPGHAGSAVWGNLELPLCSSTSAHCHH